eukprot:8589558-Prorocentrum_lima.AAC.1
MRGCLWNLASGMNGTYDPGPAVGSSARDPENAPVSSRLDWLLPTDRHKRGEPQGNKSCELQ